MAKGDLIVGQLAASGSFQPATGVEIILTTLTNTVAGGAVVWEYYDGSARGRIVEVPATGFAAPHAFKVPINNTQYIYQNQGAVSYGGVQVK